MEPNYWYAHVFLGRAYEQKGAWAEAIAEFERATKIEDAVAEIWAALGHAYAVSGNRTAAQRVIDELKQRSQRSYVPPYNLAIVYAGLGQTEQAIAWLEKAYAERSFYIVWLKREPELDRLRAAPRFTELLRRANLAP